MDQEQIQKPKFWTGGSPKIAFIFGLVVGIAVFALAGFIALSVTLGNERCAKATEQNNEQDLPTQGIESKIIGQEGTFYKVDELLCEENGKPLVLMFSTSWCSHCQWAKPIFAETVKSYVQQGKIVARQWELDTNDDTLTDEAETTVPMEDLALFEKYNPQGSIPTFIFGCQYLRVGTGYEGVQDTAAEGQEFKDLIEKLLK